MAVNHFRGVSPPSNLTDMSRRVAAAAASRRQADAVRTFSQLERALQESEQREAHIRDVLSRYKTYVETTFQQSLDDAVEQRDDATAELAMVRRSLLDSEERLAAAIADADAERRRREKYESESTETIRRIHESHAQQLQTMSSGRDRDAQSLREALASTAATNDAQRHELAHRLSVTSAQLDAKTRQVDDVERQRARIQLELEALRSELAAAREAAAVAAAVRLQQPENPGGKLSLGGFKEPSSECLKQLDEIVTDTASFVDATVSAIRRAGFSTGSPPRDEGEHPVPGPGSPLEDKMNHLRSIQQRGHMSVAAGIRSLVAAHVEMVDAVARSEHERQQDAELNRRRLAELERDRRTERETLMHALEKERATSTVHHLTALHPGGPHSAKPMPSPATGTQIRHVSLQTGPELLSQQSESEQQARLVAEIHSLQSHVAHLKSTVSILNKQRARFMPFVDDPAVTRQVRSAMVGGSGSTHDDPSASPRSGGLAFLMHHRHDS